jgi:uncharacterized membrane protein
LPLYPRLRAGMRFLLAVFFVFAAVGHFRVTDALLLITPDWVPFPRAVIYATGVFEAIAALALFPGRTRYWAGVALAVYSLCVWPANIKHALEGIDIAPLPSGWWYHGPRLAFQPVIIWWALFCGNAIDWPFHRKAEAR